MKGKERREAIIRLLSASDTAISGIALAKQLSVSRQIIVQDIALLRAEGNEIISTNNGYLLQNKQKVSRVFKVHHTDEQVAEELKLFTDYGGIVKDVFVYHKIYGVLKAEMNIKSRLDIQMFMEEIASGKSSLLMNVTSGYHYHTVLADTEAILDIIQQQLEAKGFLAQLQDYEPVNFWEEKE